jgi:uncharacterized protein YecE (DUF72 family)
MIKVGVTSWAERSLLASGWYPKFARSPAARLRWYASRFPLVENDMPYYALPEPAQTEEWARRTPPGFTMNLKAHALLTGHYTDPRRLPPDLREALPPETRHLPRVYPRHVGDEILRELEQRFVEAAQGLRGKLGVILFQFPVWFPRSRAARAELERLRERYAPLKLAVEFRNATWMSEENADGTLALLQELGLAYTCVDEPQGFPSSVPPIIAATSDVALVRLHGRNAARWRRGAASAAERFDYLYSADELRAWAPRVASLVRAAPEVHVLFNNCHADYAVRNAQQMIDLLRPLEPTAFRDLLDA